MRAVLLALLCGLAVLLLAPGSALAQIDTDNDGLPDEDERSIHGTDPAVGDTDGDGLPDGVEITLETDPLNIDTDGDGFSDGQEYLAETNPLGTEGETRPSVIDRGPPTSAVDSTVNSEPLAFDEDGDGDGRNLTWFLTLLVLLGVLIVLLRKKTRIQVSRPQGQR